jgi:hypothetical protein
MASMLMTDSRQWFPLQNSTEEWSKAVESLLGPIPTDLNGDTARGKAGAYAWSERSKMIRAV